MYILNILDDYNSVTDTYSIETIGEALEEVSRQIAANNVSIENIQLLEEVQLDFEVIVTVK